MTRERTDKRAVRNLQETAGLAYADALRLTTSFDKVLHEQPHLTYFGFGTRWKRGQTAEEYEQSFRKQRTRLASSLPNVVRVHLWLRQNIQPIKTPRHGSYGLKHIAEEVLDGYVSNGELIAAALMAGYPMCKPHGLNVDFAMSKRTSTANVLARGANGCTRCSRLTLSAHHRGRAAPDQRFHHLIAPSARIPAAPVTWMRLDELPPVNDQSPHPLLLDGPSLRTPCCAESVRGRAVSGRGRRSRGPRKRLR
ncbi:hypothetical protein [Amycolatopsis sp. PS_44_ISF1]|uniref:hypothetical protein n=1 Tax=Amycolatopsis sp. PS_44_ISF1 TaxID=2974917 RepID=UPI0028DDBB6B|nr:hypothetical protein [Amycolatopsis sp. PS_44_ISF1]MDT8912247.1 hypothetical protein [Amycolatopsis sp. PS_44_ISF1]